MSDTTPEPSAEDISAVFEYAGLTVAPERLAEHYETYASTLALIRRASVDGLGETVPAVGFNAGWY
ncbi:hypothetical protein C6A87_015785 [Mycobacterium sp. ITM-2016-00317]|jgi:hypothetical protein|uniref:hypothetical protein n=1 Tax=Mycobacterium sp. ITM-2016-00317 TaxID=2099694 RepID=UPI000D4E8739|nr:hypothetical protein [Mycobacterium sp. ITM-2016-00317]WNG85421.1 hypothetical protein C6A87_015785 [Mycobacterium sp. ITM-2016-00317]